MTFHLAQVWGQEGQERASGQAHNEHAIGGPQWSLSLPWWAVAYERQNFSLSILPDWLALLSPVGATSLNNPSNC